MPSKTLPRTPAANPANVAAGLSFHVAGPVATNVANQASSNKTGNKVQSFSFLFILVLLLLIFRSFLAPLITLAPAGIALVISMRFIGALGAHTGLKISEITELLLIVLMLGAGTDYGLFLVFRTREELRNGLATKEAVAHSMARVGESISASAATVIVALLTLLLASFGLYHDLGVPLALGIAVMLLAGLTLLPALLAVFGKAAFWPSKAVRPLAPGEVERDGWWGRVAARLVARPAITPRGRARLFYRALFCCPRVLLVGLCGSTLGASRVGRSERKRAPGQAFPLDQCQPGQPGLPLRHVGMD